MSFEAGRLLLVGTLLDARRVSCPSLRCCPIHLLSEGLSLFLLQMYVGSGLYLGQRHPSPSRCLVLSVSKGEKLILDAMCAQGQGDW